MSPPKTRVTMRGIVTVAFCLFSLSHGDVAPIYTPSYSNVYHQGVSTHRSGHRPGSTKEEVTEPPISTTDDHFIYKNFDEVNPTTDTDTATEPLSENVNITKTPLNHGPKKLNEALELTEEPELSREPDLEPTDAAEVPVEERQGTYYIYHPNGLLQKVVFTSKDDIFNMEYAANFNYENVEPIIEPVYTYDPNTFVFQRLQLN